MRDSTAAALLLCLPVLAAAQQFEAATIKPSAPYSPQTRFGVSGGPGTNSPGMITWSTTSLGILAGAAFEVPPDRIANLQTLPRAAYDVVAKLPAGTTKEQVPGMLRKLLEAQFHMKSHSEMRDGPVWLMTVAKTGAKLRPAVESDPSPQDLRTMGAIQVDRNMFPVPPRGEGATMGFNGAVRLAARSISTAKLGDLLSAVTGRPVIDKTGLTGTYDVKLSFVAVNNGAAAPPPPGASVSANDPNGPPMIFDVLQHDLGLRLDSGKAPVKFIVIDHLDNTPAGN
jgi:uncharacterized protein (TIGR03435 family)